MKIALSETRNASGGLLFFVPFKKVLFATEFRKENRKCFFSAPRFGGKVTPCQLLEKTLFSSSATKL